MITSHLSTDIYRSKMLRITDAERTREVIVPRELAEIIGVFKDMIDSPAVEGTEAVYAKTEYPSQG